MLFPPYFVCAIPPFEDETSIFLPIEPQVFVCTQHWVGELSLASCSRYVGRTQILLFLNIYDIVIVFNNKRALSFFKVVRDGEQRWVGYFNFNYFFGVLSLNLNGSPDVTLCWCPGGVTQWTSHPPQQRENPGSNPARV
jgi:hypothetical protein